MTDLVQNVSAWCAHHLGITPGIQQNVVFTLLAFLAFLVLRRIVTGVLERRLHDVARRYIVIKTVNYVLSGVLAMISLLIWFGGFTGWSAYLGIVSAGLAIALQDPLTNLAGWLFISIRKPFVVGDRIAIGDHAGDVIDVRPFQFTLIEIGNWVDADQSTGRLIHVPNGWVFKHTTANFTGGFEFIWNEIPVLVTFESDWQRAKDLLLEVARRHTDVPDDEASAEVKQASKRYMIFFQHLTPIVWTSVADCGVMLTVRYICRPRRRRGSTTAIWEDVLLAFAAEPGIDFAYPTTRFYDNPREGKSGHTAAGPSVPVALGVEPSTPSDSPREPLLRG